VATGDRGEEVLVMAMFAFVELITLLSLVTGGIP